MPDDEQEDCRLLLVYRTGDVADARKLAGMVDRLRTRPSVTSRIVDPTGLDAALGDCRRWAPSAVLATAAAPASGLAALGPIPVIRTDPPEFGDGTAHVYGHGRAIGRSAGHYLARHRPAALACLHSGDHRIARLRRSGFREAAEAAELPLHEFDTDDGRDPTTWLRSLPKPSGLFVWYDALAASILETCYEAGVQVPEELAVVGVDNTEAICVTARPSLSSVAPAFDRVGAEAVRLALDLVEGRMPTTLDREVPPEGVIERASTGLAATDDPLVLRALAAIEAGRLDRDGVDWLCTELGCSRRTLERRFRREFGRSVHGVLSDRRVRLATRLLADGRPVAEVARSCGFRRAQSLEDLLRRMTGRPPSAFRR